MQTSLVTFVLVVSDEKIFVKVNDADAGRKVMRKAGPSGQVS